MELRESMAHGHSLLKQGELVNVVLPLDTGSDRLEFRKKGERRESSFCRFEFDGSDVCSRGHFRAEVIQ